MALRAGTPRGQISGARVVFSACQALGQREGGSSFLQCLQPALQLQLAGRRAGAAQQRRWARFARSARSWSQGWSQGPGRVFTRDQAHPLCLTKAHMCCLTGGSSAAPRSRWVKQSKPCPCVVGYAPPIRCCRPDHGPQIRRQTAWAAQSDPGACRLHVRGCQAPGGVQGVPCARGESFKKHVLSGSRSQNLRIISTAR